MAQPARSSDTAATAAATPGPMAKNSKETMVSPTTRKKKAASGVTASRKNLVPSPGSRKGGLLEGDSVLERLDRLHYDRAVRRLKGLPVRDPEGY